MSDRPGRVLALFAHPDDAEFLCAGTLALLVSREWDVIIMTATPGDCGSAELPPHEIASVRRREAAAAAGLIGAAYECLEERDLAIDYDTATRRRFTEAVRSARPDIVFTHALVDYMVDHDLVGRLVKDACFTAPMPNYRGTGAAEPLEHIPHLYHCDPFWAPGDEVTGPVPSLVVNIDETMETKRRMLAEHKSQREWLRRQHHIDEYMRLQEEISRRRGTDGGSLYGEAFHQHRGHPYPREDRLAAALQEPARSTLDGGTLLSSL